MPLLSGIFASTVCPMLPDGAIDEDALEAHLGSLAAVPGLSGLLLNGHAGENAMLTRAEARRVLEIGRRCHGGVIVAGVNAETSAVAAALATDAAEAGADAVMLFAPFSWALGVDPRAIVSHHKTVQNATALPLVLFQGSVNSGKFAYSPQILTQLLALPRVIAIKEGSWETAAYDATRRLTKQLRPEVAVMASGDEHLFPCFAIGSDGSLVSLAAIIPELIIELDAAVRAGDLARGRELHARITPLARAIYGPPSGMATARLKACLVLLGRLPRATCRAPTPEPNADDMRALERGLTEAALCAGVR